MRVALDAVDFSRVRLVVARVVGAVVSGSPTLVEHADLLRLDELDELLRA